MILNSATSILKVFLKHILKILFNGANNCKVVSLYVHAIPTFRKSMVCKDLIQNQFLNSIPMTLTILIFSNWHLKIENSSHVMMLTRQQKQEQK